MMSNKILYKSDFKIFQVIIAMTFWLPGLLGLSNGYFLFFLIYTAIWYFISASKLALIHLSIHSILIKHPLSFWTKDKKIDLTNVLEFQQRTVLRGPDMVDIKYKDSKSKIKEMSFQCTTAKAIKLVEEFKKIHAHISFTTYENFLHSMK